MSYTSLESSRQSGAPIECYQFTMGATVIRLTSADVDVVVGGDVYTSTVLTSTPMARGSMDTAPNEVEVTLPRDHTVVGWLANGEPIAPITCTVTRLHRGDTDVRTLASEWKVSGLKFDGPAGIVTLSSLRSDFSRKLPLYTTPVTCPVPLYGTLCQANPAPRTYAGTVATVSGQIVTVTSATATAAISTIEAGFLERILAWQWLTKVTDAEAAVAALKHALVVFAGGKMVTAAGRQIGIRSAVGLSLTLSLRTHGLVASDAVSIVMGCDKTTSFCHVVHNNLIHYWGEPNQPHRNPFIGAGLSQF